MRHCLARVSHAPVKERFLVNKLLDSCHQAGLTVLKYQTHRFSPHGMTMVILLAESHAALHTYPERGQLYVDVFTCGKQDPADVVTGFASLLPEGCILSSQSVER